MSAHRVEGDEVGVDKGQQGSGLVAALEVPAALAIALVGIGVTGSRAGALGFEVIDHDDKLVARGKLFKFGGKRGAVAYQMQELLLNRLHGGKQRRHAPGAPDLF